MPHRTCCICTPSGRGWKRCSRENRLDLAQAAYAFLPTRARLDLLGYAEPDLFQH